MKANIGPNNMTAGAASHPQILLVDDELTLGKGLQKILKNEGYTVDYATTGQGALEYFGQKPYDLLVADLQLPDIDGLEVIKKAKGDHPDVQVIIITGYGSVPSAVTAMKLGVVDYLSKPFTKNEFVDSVHGALKIYAPMLKESAEKREVVHVLDQAAQDQAFRYDLVKQAFEALTDYEISSDAKTAIVSGDLQWIEKNIGRLTDSQIRSILTLLETGATFIEKREVTHVLERTSDERNFWLELLEKGTQALGEYRISNEAKAAIVSGDLLWIREHVGELSEKQMRWILSRLEMESWV